jgi:hypothetical protein
MGCTSWIATRRPVSAALAAFAVAVGAAGCGGDDGNAATREIERRGCLARAQNVAEAELLARLYEDGKLGTRKQIEDEAGRSFFAPDGRMLPYERMSTQQQLAFVDWKRTVDVARDERREARLAAGDDC